MLAVAFGTAANPDGIDHVKLFDHAALSKPAGEAIRAVAEAAGSGTADEPSRVLVITGQAGAGKTHLVTREFAKYSHPVYGVIIYKPDKYIDFRPWLDQKIAVKLIRRKPDSGIHSSALQHIARSALEKAFPKERGQKKSPVTQFADDVFSVIIDAADANAFTRGIKQLVRPVSQEQRLIRFAERFAEKMGISELPHANAFCAALALLGTPKSAEGSRILSSGRVPPDLAAVVSQDSVDRWNLTALLSHVIGYIGGALVVFFDQLESMVPRHGDHADSLGSLMAACLDVIQANKNCGFVISAPPEIADLAISTLQESEQQRIQLPHGVPTIELLRRGEIDRFFEPRFRYLKENGVDQASIESLQRFVAWVGPNRALVPLPPRLLLAATHRFATAQVGRSTALTEQDMESVWKSTTEKFDPRRGPVDPSSLQVPDDQASLAAIDEKWIEREAEFTKSPPDVSAAPDAAELMGWAIKTFGSAHSGVASAEVTKLTDRDGINTISYSVTFNSGVTRSRELIILDQANYNERLLNALKRVASRKLSAGSVVARLGAKLPSTGKLKSTLDQLRKSKIELVELLPAETITLKQVETLRSDFPDNELRAWFKAKAFSTPTLSICLKYT